MRNPFSFIKDLFNPWAQMEWEIEREIENNKLIKQESLKVDTVKKIHIIRDAFFGDQAVLGTCIITDGKKKIFQSESLERGWLNNKKSISCIPVGIYEVVLEYSPRFKKDLWEIKGVPNRSECKFHAANFWHQLNGCIALGKERKFIDGDLIKDISESNKTMDLFHNVLEGEKKVTLEVSNI